MTSVQFLKFAAATLIMSGVPNESIADESLLEGVRTFICDGDAIILVETDAGWILPEEPTAELRSTTSGWRYEESSASGFVWYLQEVKLNTWVIEGLGEQGYLKTDCIDLTNTITDIVAIIKPRLNENIHETERSLEQALSRIEEFTSNETGEAAKLRNEVEQLRIQLSVLYSQLTSARMKIRSLEDQ